MKREVVSLTDVWRSFRFRFLTFWSGLWIWWEEKIWKKVNLFVAASGATTTVLSSSLPISSKSESWISVPMTGSSEDNKTVTLVSWMTFFVCFFEFWKFCLRKKWTEPLSRVLEGLTLLKWSQENEIFKKVKGHLMVLFLLHF